MKLEEFFEKYANLPLAKRNIILNWRRTGITTMHDIYKRLSQIEENTRPFRIEQDKLLETAEEGFKNLVSKEIK